MSTFAQRLQELLDNTGMTQADLSRKSGLSKATLSRYLQGQFEAKQDSIYKIARAANVSEAWLMGANVSMTPGKDAGPQKPVSPVIPFGYSPIPPMEEVPLVGDIACGKPITAEENIVGRISVPDYWHATFVLTCHGDSMAPKILDGDLVAIHQQPAVENGQIAAVRIGTEATLKRVYRYPDHLELRAINPDYESIILIGEDINSAQIDGRAIGLCRGL